MFWQWQCTLCSILFIFRNGLYLQVSKYGLLIVWGRWGNVYRAKHVVRFDVTGIPYVMTWGGPTGCCLRAQWSIEYTSNYLSTEVRLFTTDKGRLALRWDSEHIAYHWGEEQETSYCAPYWVYDGPLGHHVLV